MESCDTWLQRAQRCVAALAVVTPLVAAAGLALGCAEESSLTGTTATTGVAGSGAQGVGGEAGAGGAGGLGGSAGSGPMTPEWPFERPSFAELAASPRKVLAHWHYFPLSFDNQDARQDYYATGYLDPHGENDAHYGCGGYLRERPLGRLPDPADDWLVQDMTRDAAWAHQAGIDGFLLNLWADSGPLWDRWVALLDAVAALDDGFKVAPNVDMSILTASGASDQQLQDLVVSVLAQLQSHPALLWTDDGRLVLGAFRAETRPASFYQALVQRLASDLGIDAFFVPVFLGTGSPSLLAEFAPWSGAIAGWGTAIPEALASREAFVADVHAASAGALAVAPVLAQDFRPSSYAYWEASNSRALRTQWENTIAAGADWAQIVTWNDHAEHHALRPSTGKQWAPYDLTAYYVSWFKTGSAPPIVRDALYYFHRIESTSAAPDLAQQQQPFDLVVGPADDEIELVAFLTEAGTLEIELGDVSQQQEAPAGVSSLRMPLGTGRPTFRLHRGTATVIELESAFEIRADIVFQDLLYRSGGSLRSAMGASESCQSACEGGDAEKCVACASEPVWLVANPP